MNLGAYIVHNYDFYFDAADKANGSLYLAAERGADAAAIEPTIALPASGQASPTKPSPMLSARRTPSKCNSSVVRNSIAMAKHCLPRVTRTRNIRAARNVTRNG
jgi:hypothetical protein